MPLFVQLLSILCFIQFSLCAVSIDTFYGPIDVEEPVLIDLIDSPAFQRLKHIHQYGVSYYTTHREEYTRYDHSLGVFFILRTKGASLEEQIAGLLHDVSHTVFSHVGDWIFDTANQEEDYQNSIHKTFIEKSGLESILNKYGFTADQILPKEHLFPALEQKSPHLCADRIDYNIQGAYHQGFITQQEGREILKNLEFIDGIWVASDRASMAKLVRFSLFMTQSCWGSATNYLISYWLAEAILRGVELETISLDNIHFGVDQDIWDTLQRSDDPFIQERMRMIMNHQEHYCLVDTEEQSDIVVKSKFRGIDPWMNWNGRLMRITSIDQKLNREYKAAQERMRKGWAIKLLTPHALCP